MKKNHYHFLTVLVALFAAVCVCSQELTGETLLLSGVQQKASPLDQEPERQLSSFSSLSEEFKNWDLMTHDGQYEQRRCAANFLQERIPRHIYAQFTCRFLGIATIGETGGCGINIGLQHAANLYQLDGHQYRMEALDLLQVDLESQKAEEWNEFIGYWENRSSCKFFLFNVMKWLDKGEKGALGVAYHYQRCALKYIQHHMTITLAYYNTGDFSCEYEGDSPGCTGAVRLDLVDAAFQYSEKPYQIKALNRLQEDMNRENPAEWSRFIEYWRNEEECFYIAEKGKVKILHLGDSYSAGNGASDLEVADQAFGCHRNAKSWGYEVERRLQDSCHVEYINKACHGATTPSILEEHDKRMVPKEPIVGPCPPKTDEMRFEEIPLSELEGNYDQDAKCYGFMKPQIDHVDHSIDVVLLTIGGNDILFSKIAFECLINFLPGSGCTCLKLLDTVKRQLDDGTVKEAIKNVFKALRDKLRKDARVIYSSYPHLVSQGATSKQRCLSSLLDGIDAAAMIRDYSNLFEEIQETAVAEANIEAGEDYIIFYQGTKKVFDGYEPGTGFFRDNTKQVWIHDFYVLKDAWDELGGDGAYQAYHPTGVGHFHWADGLFSALGSNFGPFCGGGDLKPEERKASLDVAIVLDTTASMDSVWEEVARQLNRIFDTLKAKTSSYRVALVEFKDFDHYEAEPDGVVRPFGEVAQHFTTDIEKVRSSLLALELTDGYTVPEAVFSGVFIALKELDWNPGSVKIMMVLGDEPPNLDPSFELPTEYSTLITADQLVQASMELDPVQIITVDFGRMTSDGIMTAISKATGGMGIKLDSVEALGAYTDLILSKTTQQPLAWIGTSYAGRVGETIKFDARGSYDPIGSEIISYVWDFDGDSVPDLTTTEPVVDHVYNSPFEGFVYVSVANLYGLEGLASAQVKIYDTDYKYKKTLPECQTDDKGLPIILDPEDGFLACYIRDSMVFMKANPDFVNACNTCFQELEGREEAALLRSAYETGNVAKFSTILCDLAANSGTNRRHLRKRGDEKGAFPKEKQGNKQPKIAKKPQTEKGKKQSKNSKKALPPATPCQALLNGAVCPRGIVT